MEVKFEWKYIMNISSHIIIGACSSALSNMMTVRYFEVMFNAVNVDRICM
jgi:hypothetical protein